MGDHAHTNPHDFVNCKATTSGATGVVTSRHGCRPYPHPAPYLAARPRHDSGSCVSSGRDGLAGAGRGPRTDTATADHPPAGQETTPRRSLQRQGLRSDRGIVRSQVRSQIRLRIGRLQRLVAALVVRVVARTSCQVGCWLISDDRFPSVCNCKYIILGG